MRKPWAEDLELSRRIASGDEAALTALVERLHVPLRRIAQAWLGNSAAADDLVQEIWETVIDHVADYQGRASLRTWITRSLVNRAKTKLARAKTHIEIEEAELSGELAGTSFSRLGLWAGQPSYALGPEEALIRQRAREWLVAALEELPPAQRAVVTLRDVEEWTPEEVCNALGVSESNQRVLLHRGRIKLRAALQAALDQERA